MKADLAEKVRSNLITQALLVALCVSFSSSRVSQTEAFKELETLYVSHRLTTTTVGDVRNNDTDDGTTPPEQMAGDLAKHLPRDLKMLEADALATFLSRAKPGYRPPSHRVPLPSGGWLRFYADPGSFKELAPAPAGSTLPLYELSFVVTKESDLHRPDEFRVTLTNAEQSLHPATRKLIWEPMRLRANVPREPEPMAETDIENRLRVKARSWSNATGTPDNLYAAARYSFENEEITIPMVNMKVSASLGLAALALSATALCAFACHQVRQAGPPAKGEAHVGVIILRPRAGTVPTGWWQHVLAQAEILFVQPPYWIGLLSPVVCTLLLALVHGDIGYSWFGWVLLPFASGYVWWLWRAIVGVSFDAPKPAAAN